MIGLDLSIDEADFLRELEASEMDMKDKAVIALKLSGAETVAFLRSLTQELRPPARPNEGPRRAHPGGWADVTGNLANAYSFDVDRVPDGAQLTLANTMEYAVYLERKDGFYVLSGVTDAGAPLDVAMRRAAARLGFEME